jgi:hypothetical protein
MKSAVLWIGVLLLAAVYGVLAWRIAHPNVSPEYRSFYMDHTSSDGSPLRYPATPADGMAFARAGLPEWVRSTVGLSLREPFGRWTDANLAPAAAVLLRQEIRGPVCLELVARAAPSMAGKDLSIRMGDEVETVHGLSGEFAEHWLRFKLTNGADKIEFLLPQPVRRESEFDAGNMDTRRLGVGLSSMRLVPGECRDGEGIAGNDSIDAH